MKFRTFLPAAFFLGALACSSDDDDASISVLLETEDVITDGLEAGDDFHDIQDGWNVEFNKYIVAVGDVELKGESEADAHEIYAIDLTQIDGSEELWKLEGLAEGDYEFNYSTLPDGAERHDSVSEEDFETMIDNDLTYLISAVMTNDEGMSCPPAEHAGDLPSDAEPAGENEAGVTCYAAPEITFNIGLEAEVVYGPCEIDGIPGVKATSGSTSTVAITIHGDHLFFNGFPEGDEGGVSRLAQWWADSDLNLDGEVTEEELREIKPSELSEIDDRYQIGAAEFDNMWEYLEAQVATQGHFQGEGECPANGESHDHGHGDEDEHGHEDEDEHGHEDEDEHGHEDEDEDEDEHGHEGEDEHAE